jgi:hypothetical protein
LGAALGGKAGDRVFQAIHHRGGVQGGKADGAQVGALGPGVGDDHHMAGLALLVGGGGVFVPRCSMCQLRPSLASRRCTKAQSLSRYWMHRERVRRASGSARSQRHWAGVVGKDLVQDLGTVLSWKTKLSRRS